MLNYAPSILIPCTELDSWDCTMEFPFNKSCIGIRIYVLQLPLATHLVARLEIKFVGMARLEVVEYDVQIGGQQTVRLLEME